MARNGIPRRARLDEAVSPLKLSALVVLATLISVPAFAQFDLGGHWGRRSNQDEMESGPGPEPVDYLGLPLK
jgi:hypothetical protein